ncbi:hypothetical protein LOK49_LG04G00932 [Camellia lanceoleosa]|uniref:Uncharacterized protein n=1 Tax=Camellia lanceoleosa TaxID=1840588 RepID=A0ACC0I0Q7_9ERIC|nr:hypothetical protein LOK49_LG04G00932 [Camellia lanceoleosa]
MVAVFNKELLCLYLINLKLKETVDAGIQNLQSPTTTGSISFPEQQSQQPPPDSLQIAIKGDDQTDNFEEGGKSPESDWVINIKEKLEQARQDDEVGAWAKICIYRVPQWLRDGDERAYIPRPSPSGPYHHSRRRLRGMDRHKWRALHHILKRTHQDIKGAVEGFKKLGYSRNDPVFAMRELTRSIQRDMIMLENQLPLFLLDRLLGSDGPATPKRLWQKWPSDFRPINDGRDIEQNRSNKLASSPPRNQHRHRHRRL